MLPILLFDGFFLKFIANCHSCHWMRIFCKSVILLQYIKELISDFNPVKIKASTCILHFVAHLFHSIFRIIKRLSLKSIAFSGIERIRTVNYFIYYGDQKSLQWPRKWIQKSGSKCCWTIRRTWLGWAFIHMIWTIQRTKSFSNTLWATTFWHRQPFAAFQALNSSIKI